MLNNNNSHGPFTPRLFIQGKVFNTGDITAYNTQLHAILYIGDQIIEDIYIKLGNIEPLKCVSVSKDIHYEANGQRLTNWIITPETETR